ncbi:uncharacterized protein LOC127038345 [Gopherus flavomarginatus]|uniref:uncharacterized protein LOC127038345 n=1 Tax=Gopherus flavomarginatus TaxID=286002 RepID=UPI0021CBCEA8|nr:uncharacterized protein LOC127038345 [Gopherus flavomarginatus]
MVSFILCLLPALLATTSAQAQTVTCQQCSGSADSCEPPAGTCTAETAKGGCITVAEENTLQGTKTTGLSRGCLDDFTGVTKDPVTVTLGNGKYVRINIAQCSIETCNSPVLDVPMGSTTANELQCPTCFSLNSDPCNSSVTPCTGDKTYCIDFAGTIRRGKFCQLAAVRELPRESHGSGTPQRAGSTPGDQLVPNSSFSLVWSCRKGRRGGRRGPDALPAMAGYSESRESTGGWEREAEVGTTGWWRQRVWGQRRNQSCLRLITGWFSPSGTTVSALVGKGCATESTKDITAGTSLVSAVYTYNFTNATSKPAENTPTSGASLSLGKFSFALYLPGLIGLLLVKLLS